MQEALSRLSDEDVGRIVRGLFEFFTQMARDNSGRPGDFVPARDESVIEDEGWRTTKIALRELHMSSDGLLYKISKQYPQITKSHKSSPYAKKSTRYWNVFLIRKYQRDGKL